MNDIPHAEQAEAPSRRFSLADLRNIIVTWGARMRFRFELEQKLKDDPHLMDDIGLTRRQFEDEISKPFWQGPTPPL